MGERGDEDVCVCEGECTCGGEKEREGGGGERIVIQFVTSVCSLKHLLLPMMLPLFFLMCFPIVVFVVIVVFIIATVVYVKTTKG